MKHRKKKTKQRPHKVAHENTATHASSNHTTRRGAMIRLRNWGVLFAAVAAGGWYLVDSVAITIAENDLSRIGNGVPAVVQIHDRRCSACVALQREARDAMRGFEDGELQYLVADIASSAGRTLATAHGVRNVTLLLFDGAGRRRQVLTGPSTSEILAQHFRAHVARHRAK